MTTTELRFHETFQPQTNYVAELLRIAANGYEGNKKDISSITGIPTGEQKGKVVPHIKYAQYMGLLDVTILTSKRFHLELTEFGQEVLNSDPYLQERLTLLICHGNIANSMTGAPQWQYLFCQTPHRANIPISKKFLKKSAEDHFGVSVDLGVTINSYDGGFFSPISLITQSADEITFLNRPPSAEELWAYGYLLFYLWEQQFPTVTEITVDELYAQLKFHDLLAMDANDILRVLDDLADAGVIAINCQLMPMTIRKLMPAQNLIPQLYSNLL